MTNYSLILCTLIAAAILIYVYKQKKTNTILNHESKFIVV